jgi:poly-gamma-glutamate capsule biosynthesis protein CapA/YwtB (metallophosphatase superfamily)
MGNTAMQSNVATFITGGDIAPTAIAGPGMFGELASLFEAADFSFLNVEHPLSGKGNPTRGKKFLHHGNSHHIEGLRDARIGAVNLANNHMLDFGDDGLFDTIAGLDRAGIPHFGAGKNLSEAAKPLILERKGIRLGLLGYTTLIPMGSAATAHTAGTNAIRVRTAYRPPYNLDEIPGTAPVIETWPEATDLDRLCSAIGTLKSMVHVVLVYVHWGTSLVGAIHHHQTAIGRAAIDAGADGVFGGHQHVVSAIEFYRNKPIIHCSGDLIFDVIEPWFDESTERNILFGANITNEGLDDCYILCCETGIGRPPRIHLPESPIGHAILRDLRLYSEAFGTEFNCTHDRILVGPGTSTQPVPIHRAALHPMGVQSCFLTERPVKSDAKLLTSGERLQESKSPPNTPS